MIVVNEDERISWKELFEIVIGKEELLLEELASRTSIQVSNNFNS